MSGKLNKAQVHTRHRIEKFRNSFGFVAVLGHTNLAWNFKFQMSLAALSLCHLLLSLKLRLALSLANASLG